MMPFNRLTKSDGVNVHLLWIIAILLLFGIWQFSIVWKTASELVSALSLAIGLTSLVVGVYAIFQGLVSGNSLNQVATGLRESAAQVADVANRVEKASSELGDKISSIPDKFDEVKEKIDQLYQTQTSQAAESKAGSSSNSIPFPLKAGEIVSLYIAHLAVENKRNKINVAEMFPDNLVATNYTLSYLTALTSWKIVDGVSEKNSSIIEVISLNKIKSSEILSAMERNKATKFIAKNKPIIDKYFDNTED